MGSITKTNKLKIIIPTTNNTNNGCHFLTNLPWFFPQKEILKLLCKHW